MNKRKIISGNLLEAYCLGIATQSQNEEIEQMARLYPDIQEDIDRLKISLQIYSANIIPPRAAVKANLMRSVYQQQAVKNKTFVPLMDGSFAFDDLHTTIAANDLKDPTEAYDNLYVQGLPSTREVINMAVWVKKEHEKEIHTDMDEFIAVLQGSCDIYTAGKKTSYSSGQVISIPRNVLHHGIVTSPMPMFGVVQRQMF